MNTTAHWLHNVPTDCHIYAIFFPLATEKTFNSLEIYFISYFFIPFFASLFLDKRLIDDSIHYHFSNNLLVHTYLSTTDYADYYPTQDNIVVYETDFTLGLSQKYHSYNWFKIDIHQQLRPLTANYLAMFKVISSTIYT